MMGGYLLVVIRNWLSAIKPPPGISTVYLNEYTKSRQNGAGYKVTAPISFPLSLYIG
jgi:hypothetical protein